MSYPQLKKMWYGIGKPGSMFRDPTRLFNVFRKKYPKTKLSRFHVGRWLDLQEPVSLHKNVRKNFPRNPIHVRVPFYQYGIDLIDFTAYKDYNKGKKWILLLIDIFSKKIYVRTLKSKTGIEVSLFLEEILKELPIKPRVISADLGPEFWNQHVQKVLKKYNIHLFLTQGVKKNAVVERVNRTFEELIWTLFDTTKDRKYLDQLQNIAESYNEAVHSRTKIPPNKVNHLNAHIVYKNLYGHLPSKRKTPKFKSGDVVRIALLHDPFAKKFEQKWGRAVFKIHGKPYFPSGGIYPMYKVEELDGTLMPGKYYEPELMKLDKDRYLTKFKFPYEVIRKDKRGTFVRWLGYKKKYDSYL